MVDLPCSAVHETRHGVTWNGSKAKCRRESATVTACRSPAALLGRGKWELPCCEGWFTVPTHGMAWGVVLAGIIQAR